MSWLLLEDAPAAGAWNMALDEALLEAADQGLSALRLYAWDPPTLSFGRHEPALRRYDRELIRARGLATVRRPTGGRAVWHQHELTYAVAASVRTFGSLRDSYHEIHAMLAEALAALGARVGLAGARAPLPVGAGACFAGAAGGEVISAGGAKIVGSAQVRSGGAFLQHGSLLLEAGQDVVASLTRGGAGEPQDAGVADLVEGPVSWAAVARAVEQTARRRWETPVAPAALPEALRRRAEALTRRYSDDAWTWRR